MAALRLKNFHRQVKAFMTEELATKTNTSLTAESLELQIPYKSYEPEDSNKEKSARNNTQRLSSVVYYNTARYLSDKSTHLRSKCSGALRLTRYNIYTVWEDRAGSQ